MTGHPTSSDAGRSADGDGDRGDGDRGDGAAGPSPGRLFLVSTPIGNLEDMTLRAIRVLGEAGVVAAEDTRTTRVLLARHGIHARLTSYHARNAARRSPELLAGLRSGLDVALVTDAGTPGVSDPGAELVAAWAAEGGLVVPIPGPSAALAAVVASAVAGPRWTFEGFLPRAGRVRRERLAAIAADERGCVIFEAANRTAGTLADLALACGALRPAAVCRELTKVHEQIVRGRLGELSEAARDGTLTLRGEIVLVVGAAPGVRRFEEVDLRAARAAVDRLTATGVARGAAVRRVADETGIPRRRLYGAQAATE